MKRALVAASALAILAGAQSFAQTVGVGPAKRSLSNLSNAP
jgi:hypothetical protein